jgi:hypothetical protein
MSEDRIEKVEQTLRVVQARLRELDREARDSLRSPRYAAGACAVAGAMIALTATPWRTGQEVLPSEGQDWVDNVATLWDMATDGWQAAFTLILVLVVGVGTIVVFTWNNSDAKVYIAFAVLAVLTVVGVLISHAGKPADSFEVSEYQYLAGRWLTLFAAFGLAFMHGGRAAELRSAT